MSAHGKWGLGLGALAERVSGWSWYSWLRAPNPILACFLPKALVLRGAWWVLRPTHPGVTSSKLGKALTWGVSWRGTVCEQLSLASQPPALIRLIHGLCCS